MTQIVEMYRRDQYGSWEEAGRGGGIYNLAVHVPEAMEAVNDAIATACLMMDGGADVETRVRGEAPDGFDQFFASYCRHFVGTERGLAIVAVTQPDRPDVRAMTQVRDAWFLWNDALKY